MSFSWTRVGAILHKELRDYRRLGGRCADHDRDRGQAQLGRCGYPVKPGDELERPATQRDIRRGGAHDDGDEHPLQADRPGERANVVGVERSHVLGDVDLLQLGGAVGRCTGGGGHLALVRREALCCIPGAAGMNSKEGSWV
jgi:hypothetical protein